VSNPVLSPEDFLLSHLHVTRDDFGNLQEVTETITTQCIDISESEQGLDKSNFDPRVMDLSYSSLLTLHSCPRKYELYKKRTTHRSEQLEKETITFSYGHIVGEAIQGSLAGLSKQEIIWKMFLRWAPDLFAEDTKSNKSFWSAILALEKFQSIRAQGFLDEYELVYYEDKPAVELSFCINFPDGFRLRGFVDAVLRNKNTGAVMVLELKTTGANTVNPAQFKNSAQAIGYSIVLDVLFPDINSYEVLYLVYQTLKQDFIPIPFNKSYLQRALWIRSLLHDIEIIKMYEDSGIYPMHGESCFSFFRECEYINTCQLSTQYLTKPYEHELDKDNTEYQITLSLVQIIDAQLNKVHTS
jgi:hypothetical protein